VGSAFDDGCTAGAPLLESSPRKSDPSSGFGTPLCPDAVLDARALHMKTRESENFELVGRRRFSQAQLRKARSKLIHARRRNEVEYPDGFRAWRGPFPTSTPCRRCCAAFEAR